MAGIRLRISGQLLRFAPLIAAVVFGGWAAFVNRDYGLFVLVRTGLGQGLYALFSTWIVSRTAAQVSGRAGGKIKGFILGFTASFLVMLSIPLAIHYALGTPRIFAAILPGLAWGSGYIATYLWVLSRDGAGQGAH